MIHLVGFLIGAVALLAAAPPLFAAEAARGFGGPQEQLPSPKVVLSVQPEKTAGKSRKMQAVRALPKGMKAPGQGPFPNVLDPKAEGVSAPKVILKPQSQN